MPWSGESQRWLWGLTWVPRLLFRQGLSNWQVPSDRKKWDFFEIEMGFRMIFFEKNNQKVIHLSCVVWSLINFFRTFTQQRLDITRWASSQSYLSKCAMISLRCARDSWLFARHSATHSATPGEWCRDHEICQGFDVTKRWKCMEILRNFPMSDVRCFTRRPNKKTPLVNSCFADSY